MYKGLATGQGKGGKEKREISMSGDAESRGASRVKGDGRQSEREFRER